MTPTHLVTSSERETEQAGRRSAVSCRPVRWCCSRARSGAGKTAFVRGLAAGLGCDLDSVSSPTFTIIQEYPGPVRLQHVDLYRLAPHEVDDLLLEELMDGAVHGGRVAGSLERAPADAVRVDIATDRRERASADDQNDVGCHVRK